MNPRAVAAFVCACALAGLAGCRGSQVTGPALFFDNAWYAAPRDKGAVWFFPVVEEADGWNESRVDRVRCPAILPQFWCAPITIQPAVSPEHRSIYGSGFAGPFGVAITSKVPQQRFAVSVRNQSYFGMGFGEDCPPESRTFPVHPESFTVVAIDSRAYRLELASWRYCPSTSVLGVVSHAPGREAAQRAIALAAAGGNDASLRIAALEALARSPDNDRCREVHDLVRRIQDGDPSRRVRGYAKELWPTDRLARAQSSGALCWP